MADAPISPADGIQPPDHHAMTDAAIDGAWAFGFMDTNPPPTGHWLTKWWQRGRAYAIACEHARGAGNG